MLERHVKLDSTGDLVGVVPAAGKGSRLAPYPHSKELLPVGYQLIDTGMGLEKRPKVIAQYLVEGMQGAGIRKLFFIVSAGKSDIMEYFGGGDAFGVRIAYLYQSRLGGMPYALDLVTPWLGPETTVVMGMPDTVIEPQDAFDRLLSAHRAWKADLTLGLFQTEQPQKFGMIGFDEDFRVTEHVDKPDRTHLKWLWGMACWGPRFTALMHATLTGERADSFDTREVVLGDFFDLALAQGLDVRALPFPEGRYIDVGTYSDLKKAWTLYA